MPLLLYGMTEADSGVGLLSPGFREATVESLTEGGVRCFYSRVDELSGDAERFRADALRFHAVLHEILDRAAVVPFRFPTLLAEESGLREFLKGQASAYSVDLQRVRGMVQMEVRIRPQPNSSCRRSGKEYMEARATEARMLTALVETARATAGELASEWRAREETGGLRCYALVRREHIPAFEQLMRELSPVDSASILVSGPWPATEFLHVRSS